MTIDLARFITLVQEVEMLKEVIKELHQKKEQDLRDEFAKKAYLMADAMIAARGE